jgi:uncharacterized membrane protein YccC
MPAGSNTSSRSSDPSPIARWQAALANAGRVTAPPLLFGLRMWAAVCLALYVAFWLELDNAYWAGTSAALVCQPHLGASLRKGWFRMIGTVVGAVAIVLLTAAFPQERGPFLIGLALWGAGCALVATQLRNFAAYAAALAGYTAAIIASDQLGATGGPNGQAFMLAITRVSEIWIGIACAGIVLAGTDRGGAPRRLAALFAGLAAEIAGRFTATLARSGPAFPELQMIRRELLRRVITLDPTIDEAIGESSQLRYHSPVLQSAVAGLFAALAAWRPIALRLSTMPDEAARQADAVLLSLPSEFRSAPATGDPAPWIADPLALRQHCAAAVRRLLALPAGSPSLRLIADQAARVLAGFCHALDGLALLTTDPDQRGRRRGQRLHVADWLPALVDGGRAFLAIGAAEIFWITSQWPSGALAITWTAITVILFAPRSDESYARVISFTLGNTLAAISAAIMLFAILPNVETFVSFSLVLALYLIPIGALTAQPWQLGLFTPMAANIVPLLAPANPMSYDTLQFYNTALALIVGCGIGALSFRLVPPLSPELRAGRLTAFALRDLRRLATTTATLHTPEDWQDRMYHRLAAVPDASDPLKRAHLMAALSVGIAILHLRRAGPALGLNPELDSALAAFAEGHSALASATLGRLDDRLAPLTGMEAGAGVETSLAVRARGRILLVRDALRQHQAYFDRREAG